MANEKNLEQGIKFSNVHQPVKRGRKRNVFGALAKENALSLTDVRNVFKNILTADYAKLEELKERYPCSFVRTTIDVFRQETFGVLSGRTFKIEREDGGVQEVQERIKSYELTRYMLDRCFGPITKMEAEKPAADTLEVNYLVYLIKETWLQDYQREFINDDGKYLVSCGGRQSGKTEAVAAYLTITALKYPGSTQTYMCAKSGNLSEQLYRKIKTFLEHIGQKGLGHIRDFDFVFSNGSIIRGIGLDNSVKLKDYFKGNSYTQTIVIDEAGDNRFIDLESFLYVVQPITGNVGVLRERYEDPDLQQRIIIQGNPWDAPGTILQGAWESESTLFKKFQWNTMKNRYFKGKDVALEYLRSKTREEIAPPLDGDFTESYVDALASEGLIRSETAEEFKKMYLGIPGKLDGRLVMFPHIRCAPHNLQPTHFLAGVDYGFQDYCGLVIIAADQYTGRGNVVYQVYGNRTNAKSDDWLEEWSRMVYHGYREVSEGYRVPLDKIHGCGDTSNNEWTHHIASTYKIRLEEVKKARLTASYDICRELLNSETITVPPGPLYEELHCAMYTYERLSNGEKYITGNLDEDITPKHGGHFDVFAAFRYALTLYTAIMRRP